MYEDVYHLPMEDIMAIEVRMGDKAAIDTLAKNFQYDEDTGVTRNLKMLSDRIVTFLQLSGKVADSLRAYLVQKNIPIEVNFKPLKGDQLVNILEQWISLHSENSTILQKLYSNNHRNILFKRVLFEEKQRIDDHFSSLSKNGMLKAVDLYQLLVEILSSYNLYEFKSDGETFFQKINSFNTFLEVTKRFLHSEKRIAFGTTKEDFELVRRFEFQRLIEYWESENPELILLSDKRKNLEEAEVQTTLINVHNQQTQTMRTVVSLTELINQTLSNLNKLTAESDNYNELKSIQRIYACIKKEKINIMSNYRDSGEDSEIFSEKTEKLSPKSRQRSATEMRSSKPKTITSSFLPLTIKIDQVEPISVLEKPIYIQKLTKLQIKDPIHLARTLSPNKKIKEIIGDIYRSYSDVDKMNVFQLEKCLMDIGVIEEGDKELINGFVKRSIIRDTMKISLEEFRQIFRRIMAEDKDLKIEVLEEFLKVRKSSYGMERNPRMQSNLSYPRYIDHRLNSTRDYIGRYYNNSHRL